MGVLEDAIRQHLELKRQHGASEEELDRQQAEALGPAVRREEPAPAEGEAAADPDSFQEPDAPPHAVDEGALHVEVSAGEPPAAHPDEHATEIHADDPAAVDHRDDLVPSAEPEHHGDALLEPEPAPSEHAADTHPAPPERAGEHEPAVSFDDEDDPIDWDAPSPGEPATADPAEAARDGESEHADPLEETPDFLEDTPEHDRLWFEQRPPRDFDFD